MTTRGTFPRLLTRSLSALLLPAVGLVLPPAAEGAPVSVHEVVMAAADVATPWGEAVQLTATGLPADATGTVTFSVATAPDGASESTVLCSADVIDGGASCSGGAGQEVGGWQVTAAYSGDDANAPTTDALTWTVSRAVRIPRLRVAGRIPSASRAVLRLRLDPDPCSHVYCRTTAAEDGVVTWRVRRVGTSKLRLVHRSSVVGGRATWWTPRLRVPGRYYVRADFHGTHYVDANAVTTFRVSRP